MAHDECKDVADGCAASISVDIIPTVPLRPCTGETQPLAIQTKDDEGIDPQTWLESVKKCRYLPSPEMLKLCRLLTKRLMKVPTCVSVQSPVTICGDIHGQFYDLLTLFETGGDPKNTRYVFLGDYVDRGHYSLETLTYLFLLMAAYPDNITLIRGNHESRLVSLQYGFYEECSSKYGHSLVWTECCKVFDLLPIAAVVDGHVFCVHGGLSPELRKIDTLYTIPRDLEVSTHGLLCDLLWSDPDETHTGWTANVRGAGYIFGGDIVAEFAHDNNVDLICRSHQLVMEGFKYFFNETLATVWSAPNYCYRCGNVASILKLDGNEREIRYFDTASQSVDVVPDRIVAPYFL